MNQAMPEQFGKYELLKRLAFGGMAEIFLARLRGEAGFSKQLVVKRILPQFGEDAHFVKMFIDEAVLAAHINHPNVVQIYDFGSTDGVYFIAMEYVDGADLREIIRYRAQMNEPLGFAEVAAIGEGAAAGLARAHTAKDPDGVPLQIVHRDVSPHNIMIGQSGDVKVMDFGIARAEVRATKTATGTIKGKVAYMAPEHGAGEQADARSDQFSLGAVLWECLAGERLYGGDSELEVLRNVLDARIRPLESMRADVPSELSDIVSRMLAREPGERFASMSDVREALSRFRYTLGPSGAVDLGANLMPASRTVAPRSSGTLVLEDEASTGLELEPVANDVALETAPLAEPKISGAPTATLPMNEQSTQPWMEPGGKPDEPKTSKLWALALVGLIVGALGWISMQGESRMEAREKLAIQSALNLATVRVVSEPAGAAIWVDGSPTDKFSPATLDSGSAGASIRLELRLEGYKAWTDTLQVKAGENFVAAKLDEVPSQKAVETPPPRTKVRPKSKRKQTKVKPVRKTSVADENQKPGRLFLRSSGLWFHVFLNGQQIGTTPLSGVSVPAGRQRLTLRNDVAGIERTIEIDVTPGGVIRRTVAP